MTVKTKTKPVSASSGRGLLQREGIVQTALTLMNALGLEALSLRRLADELHVQAPALYWHFKNKQELLDAMAEQMLLSAEPLAPPAAPTQEWADWLVRMGTGLYNALARYRDGARLLAVADVSRTSIASLELTLAVLIDAGFRAQPALAGIMTMVNFVVGFTLEEQSTFNHSDDAARVQALLDSQTLPHLQALFKAQTAPFPPERELETSLRLIVDGMKTRL